jgi:mRNA interferase RelE/StbE
MPWKIEILSGAQRDLDRLDRQVAKRITDYFEQRVCLLPNPKMLGHALKGERFGELWSYRIGDYRALAKFRDDVLIIVLAEVAHRREVYRR